MENIVATFNTVNFGNERCSVKFAKYPNGITAIQLICMDGQPMALPTVNMPHINSDPAYVLVKDYSENEGAAEVLEDAGILQRVKSVGLPPFGACVWICALLKHPEDWLTGSGANA